MIDTYLANLQSVYKQASALEIAEGRLWYPSARGELFDIAKRLRVPLKRLAYATAALSNNMTWESNVALAEQVAFDVSRGIPANGHWATLLDKATRILRNGDFKALSGPKVEPFARALLGDLNAAVVDRWIWRAAWGNLTPTPTLTFKRHREVAVALRRLAKLVHRPVVDVQAITWLVIQRLCPEPLTD